MTDDKELVAAMKDQLESWEFEDPRETWWKWQHQYAQAADRIAALEAENARLREALEQFLSLIEYQYCGSREAMNALQEADNSARAALEPMSKENAETFARSGNV